MNAHQGALKVCTENYLQTCRDCQKPKPRTRNHLRTSLRSCGRSGVPSDILFDPKSPINLIKIIFSADLFFLIVTRSRFLLMSYRLGHNWFLIMAWLIIKDYPGEIRFDIFNELISIYLYFPWDLSILFNYDHT